MPAQPLNVYIGYDGVASQPAYDVCVASLLEHASIPVNVVKVDQDWLRRISLYRRTFYEVDGQRYDTIDGRPFSTAFSFSRFFVPLLQPEGWALWLDQDFMWRADVAELAELFDDRYAAMVVQHDYNPAAGTKMLGQIQQPYSRKNWSSLIAWNCSSPATRLLTSYQINQMPGWWLHGFKWLRDAEIGDLPEAWNWLDGHSTSADPKAVHFTRGTPDMAGWEGTRYAAEWLDIWGALNGDH